MRTHGDDVATAASPDVPVLRLDSTGQPLATDRPAWTTRLSVLAPGAIGQHPAAHAIAAHLSHCELVLTQRLARHDIAVLAQALNLPTHVQEALAVMPDAVLAVLTPSGVRYAWVNFTPAEREVLGALPRH